MEKVKKQIEKMLEVDRQLQDDVLKINKKLGFDINRITELYIFFGGKDFKDWLYRHYSEIIQQ